MKKLLIIASIFFSCDKEVKIDDNINPNQIEVDSGKKPTESFVDSIGFNNWLAKKNEVKPKIDEVIESILEKNYEKNSNFDSLKIYEDLFYRSGDIVHSNFNMIKTIEGGIFNPHIFNNTVSAFLLKKGATVWRQQRKFTSDSLIIYEYYYGYLDKKSISDESIDVCFTTSKIYQC